MPFDLSKLPENIYELSDEEFDALVAGDTLKADASAEGGTETQQTEQTQAAAEGEQQQTAAETSATVTPADETQTTEAEGQGSAAEGATTETAAAGAAVGEQPGTEGSADPAAAGATTAAEDTTDYKAKYEAIMAPFKAGGQEITLMTPEEARTLMQKGVGYTRRMQELAPQRKLVAALQQAGLTEMDQVMHLIEVSKGNPAAIQKLLKDKQVDPLSLDPEQSAAYVPQIVPPSDDDLRFADEIAEAKASEHGQAMIQQITQTWDAQSQNILGETPGMLAMFTKHREIGAYDVITAEMARRQALGQLPNQPFVHSYKAVGDELHAAGKLVPKGQPPVQTNQQENTGTATATTQIPDQGNAGTTATAAAVARQPLAVRSVAKPPAATKAAAAASPSRSASATQQKLTMADLTRMTDEEIDKLDPRLLP